MLQSDIIITVFGLVSHFEFRIENVVILKTSFYLKKKEVAPLCLCWLVGGSPMSPLFAHAQFGFPLCVVSSLIVWYHNLYSINTRYIVSIGLEYLTTHYTRPYWRSSKNIVYLTYNLGFKYSYGGSSKNVVYSIYMTLHLNICMGDYRIRLFTRIHMSIRMVDHQKMMSTRLTWPCT